MKTIFNDIQNIAIKIQNDIFKHFDNFTSEQEATNHVEKIVYNTLKSTNIKQLISITDKKSQDIDTNGKYIITYVPIDTPSLLQMNFSLGTLFTIYEESISANNIKAVIYITYGPTFQLVFASKENKVQYYDFIDDKFVLKGDLTLNQKGKINSTGGDVTTWSKEHKELMESFFAKGYRLRFSNVLTLDTHQILFKKGGIYSNPATKKDPNGILNTIFEAFPISFVIELANGISTDGKNRILDITNPTLEDKTPIYFGSKDELEQVSL